jgi:hypothetical protein
MAAQGNIWHTAGDNSTFPHQLRRRLLLAAWGS